MTRSPDPSRRLNIGCGQYPFLGWTNLDADPAATADLYAMVPPIPFYDGSLDEIFIGHCLEHFTPETAAAQIGRASCRERVSSPV